MSNGVKEIMDAITAMVDAEHDRLTKEIREAAKKSNGDNSKPYDWAENDKDMQSLIEERNRIEDWMVTMARAGDTANVLPRNFLNAIDVYPGRLF